MPAFRPRFVLRIDDDGSHSVEREKVFIYDIALLLNEYTKSRHPGLLVHDNIFDVDDDTLRKSLEFIPSSSIRRTISTTCFLGVVRTSKEALRLPWMN
jgi:uncharacterized protein YydD (DUF2326 family)